MNKTKDLIIKVLKEEKNLNSRDIQQKLEGKKHSVAYDTVSKNLKQMVERGILIREIIAKKRENKYSWESNYHPWNYFYQLNEGFMAK